MQLDFAAGALFRGVHHASVEWARVDVQTDGTLVEFLWIDDAMYGISWVDRTRMCNVHLHGVERCKLAVTGEEILMYKVEVFDLEPAKWDRHPAVLVAMVVNGANLTHFPANGHQFIERRAIDQIARIVLPIPGEIRCEGLGINRHLREQLPQRLSGDESGVR